MTKGALVGGEGVHVVLLSVPDEPTGRTLARALVEERLAACGNLLPITSSVYRWQGDLVEEPEWLLLLKTHAARLDALAARLVELHPYDVPELLALPVERGLPAYLDWVRQETRG